MDFGRYGVTGSATVPGIVDTVYIWIKKFWKAEMLSKHTIAIYVGSKVISTFDIASTYIFWWSGWKALSLSFPKIENRLNIVISKDVDHFELLAPSTYKALQPL